MRRLQSEFQPTRFYLGGISSTCALLWTKTLQLLYVNKRCIVWPFPFWAEKENNQRIKQDRVLILFIVYRVLKPSIPCSAVCNGADCRPRCREFKSRPDPILRGDWSWNVFYGWYPPSADFKKGCCQLQTLVRAILVNRVVKFSQENNVVRLNDRLDMTIVVEWDVKPQTKQICWIYLSMELKICNHYFLAHSRDLRSVRLSLCQGALLEEMGVTMLPRQPMPLGLTYQQIFPLLKYSFQRL